MTTIVHFSFSLFCRFFRREMATQWQVVNWPMPRHDKGCSSEQTPLFPPSNRLFPAPSFLCQSFSQNAICANPLFRRTYKDSHRENVSLTLRRPAAQHSPRANMFSGVFSRTIHRLITVIFPIVGRVFFRQQQFSSICERDTRKSLGSVEPRVSCRAAICLFPFRFSQFPFICWDSIVQQAGRRLSKVSRATLLLPCQASGILLIRLHHASCHPSPTVFINVVIF